MSGSSSPAPRSAPAPAGKGGRFAELPVRIASALVLLALVLYSVWQGGLTYLLLVGVAALIVWYEFWRITRMAMPLRVGWFSGAFLLLAVFAMYGAMPKTAALLITLGMVIIAAWEWLLRRSAWGAAALAYSGYFLVALGSLRDGNHGILVILFLAACVWGSDTFAYFSGKLIGGPKLAPRISPNKTWAGFAGGFAGAVILSSLVLHFWQGSIPLPAILLAMVLALFSQAGDLGESWLKRRFSVKDSSRIIPGHGGLMDRIDGLIIAGTALFAAGWIIASGASGFEALPDAIHAAWLSG